MGINLRFFSHLMGLDQSRLPRLTLQAIMYSKTVFAKTPNWLNDLIGLLSRLGISLAEVNSKVNTDQWRGYYLFNLHRQAVDVARAEDINACYESKSYSYFPKMIFST